MGHPRKHAGNAARQIGEDAVDHVVAAEAAKAAGVHQTSHHEFAGNLIVAGQRRIGIVALDAEIDAEFALGPQHPAGQQQTGGQPCSPASQLTCPRWL